MLIAPPEILKVAREFLGFSQEQVEKHAGISRATIQRVERGVRDLPQYVLLLQHFYEKCGIEFVAPAGNRGWGLYNHNTAGKSRRLNKLTRSAKAPAAPKPPSPRKAGHAPG
ncbi:helix-turn-helix domain-containing protein [Rhizobium sp. N113]|uniref:helix-turn-helix domain-containing protein n=1 Tax=unclassified Rhizobium TaxID=2613769 RepID=UPI0007EA739E|nr:MULTISPECIES: helix-turn-helix transcriptional regulator [unclassified Rhizobium]ANL10261.1 helix-turn-helix domain-containing protein [Rhizobium sp. N1341]ANL22313.1 helix-turn-helix domain-containing protein [Rhizobium sp. N113]ANM41147.1 helix-turn-helix domain-containing protein [Rhizobium sp. N741]